MSVFLESKRKIFLLEIRIEIDYESFKFVPLK
jgi:hypothetical protein